MATVYKSKSLLDITSKYNYEPFQAPRHTSSTRPWVRSISPPPLCVDPKTIDPGFGLPTTHEGWLEYPLSGQYIPPPVATSPGPSTSASDDEDEDENVPVEDKEEDVENYPVLPDLRSPSPEPPKKKRRAAKKTVVYVVKDEEEDDPDLPYLSDTPEHPRKRTKMTPAPAGGQWGTQQVMCKKCGTKVQARQMKRHIIHIHPRPEIGKFVSSSVRTCEWCGKEFSRKDARNRHEKICKYR